VLTGLRDAYMAGKPLLLDVSVRVFPEKIDSYVRGWLEKSFPLCVQITFN
jgi:hypothetical protein